MERWATAPCYYMIWNNWIFAVLTGSGCATSTKPLPKKSSSKLFWKVHIFSARKQPTNLNPKASTQANKQEPLHGAPIHVNRYGELPKRIPSFIGPGFVVLHFAGRSICIHMLHVYCTECTQFETATHSYLRTINWLLEIWIVKNYI